MGIKSLLPVGDSAGVRSSPTKYLFVPTLLLAFGLLIYFVVLAGPASAAETEECSDGVYLRWSGNVVPFDVDDGDLPVWWENEIIYASGVWGHSSVGADFDFEWDSSSSYDWYKYTDNDNSAIATTAFTYNETTCRFYSMETWFNTRWGFAICDDCNDGTYDVKTVAIHEFGHWLWLGHVPWWKVWDHDCVMYTEHGTDHTLCDDDIEGIVEIYGED